MFLVSPLLRIVITDASKILPQQQSKLTPLSQELTYVKGVTSAIQTQLGLKAPPFQLFTGTVTILTVHRWGGFNDCDWYKINYVAGVTSAMQTQIDREGGNRD